MPTKMLDSQTDRKGNQDTFKFGGGANTIFADDIFAGNVDVLGYGYIINGGGGDDTIFGSEYAGPPDPLPEQRIAWDQAIDAS